MEENFNATQAQSLRKDDLGEILREIREAAVNDNSLIVRRRLLPDTIVELKNRGFKVVTDSEFGTDGGKHYRIYW